MLEQPTMPERRRQRRTSTGGHPKAHLQPTRLSLWRVDQGMPRTLHSTPPIQIWLASEMTKTMGPISLRTQAAALMTLFFREMLTSAPSPENRKPGYLALAADERRLATAQSARGRTRPHTAPSCRHSPSGRCSCRFDGRCQEGAT